MAKFLNDAGLARFWSNISPKIAAKQDKLTGESGQVVGFDAEGNAIAQAMPGGGGGGGGNVPVGTIWLWHGAADTIPPGWAICDGTNGTPDLRGRFALGASEDYPFDSTGGEAEHTLTVEEMPNHNHSLILTTGGSGSYGYILDSGTSTAETIGSTEHIVSSGGSQPHNNMPPYYVLHFIKKIYDTGDASTLERIEITVPPTRLGYRPGDIFDPTGMEVLAFYSNGTHAKVMQYSVDPYGALTTDDTKVIVSFASGGVTKTAEQEILVADIPANLDDATWDQIRQISDTGRAADYWSVGDFKWIVLANSMGILSASGRNIRAFIIGFDHNSELEGTNRIHFQIGQVADYGGQDVALRNTFYDTTNMTDDVSFCMNKTSTNVGGWNGSYMRNTICPAFESVVPSDLLSNLKTVTKYTDNTGNKSTDAASITATTEKFFLLSEYEALGITGESNAYEASKQKQYEYYASGNSVKKYAFEQTYTAISWWLRSPLRSSSQQFFAISSSGTPANNYANKQFGFAPCFCV